MRKEKRENGGGGVGGGGAGEPNCCVINRLHSDANETEGLHWKVH